MIDVAVSGVRLTLRYEKGSYSFAHLKADAGDAALYETAGALNSLQMEHAKSISKTTTRKLIDLG
jgi:hypothetical protein